MPSFPSGALLQKFTWSNRSLLVFEDCKTIKKERTLLDENDRQSIRCFSRICVVAFFFAHVKRTPSVIVVIDICVVFNNSFGPDLPKHTHQLDGEERIIEDGYGMYQYYFKIVPTLYRYLNGTVIQSNQFSVTEHLRHVNPGSGRGLPGVFFFYEVSPLHVEMVEGYRKGYVPFLTSVCCVLGGVVTTMGLLDQLIHNTHGRRASGGRANGGVLPSF